MYTEEVQPSFPADGHIYVRVAAYAIFIREGRILLMQYKKEGRHGLWGLPGGNIDIGETIEMGLAREVFEETGITPTEYKAREIAVIHESPTEKVRHLFIAELRAPREAFTIHAEEALDLCWFELASAEFSNLAFRWPWLKEFLLQAAASPDSKL